MAVNRASQSQNKKTNNLTLLKREMAILLRAGKEEKARIKAEQYIQDQKVECALDVLGTMCELLATRLKYLESEKECPADLVSTVSSILYCEKRTEVEDLSEVRKQLQLKFGREWVETCASNRNQEVHFKLIQLLTLTPPPETHVVKVLREVAGEYGVAWSAPPELEEDLSFLHDHQAPQAPPLLPGPPPYPDGPLPPYHSNTLIAPSQPGDIAWHSPGSSFGVPPLAGAHPSVAPINESSPPPTSLQLPESRDAAGSFEAPTDEAGLDVGAKTRSRGHEFDGSGPAMAGSDDFTGANAAGGYAPMIGGPEKPYADVDRGKSDGEDASTLQDRLKRLLE